LEAKKKNSETGGKMKKRLLVTSLALLGGLAMCSTASAVLTGSKHDFTALQWGNSQICLPCHAPHNNKNAQGSLLWNHTLTTSTYSLYSSPTFDATPGQPTAVSKFCLSCHDGSIALDAYGSHTGNTTITGNALLGTDLSNDHPISFDYNAALVTKDTASGGGIAGLASPASDSLVVAGIPLFSGKMECASCHDVHNKHGFPGLLNASNAGSALCLKCHTK
jgi:predicted CXXCH cytochrome family protein